MILREERRKYEIRTMATMTLILMTLTLMTATHGESIRRTNFGYSLESLEPQVHFSTNNGRIIILYTMSQLITVEMTPEQKNEENKHLITRVQGKTPIPIWTSCLGHFVDIS